MADPLIDLLLVAATFGIGVFGSLAGLVLGNLRLPLLLTLLPPATAGGTNVTVSGAGAGAGTLAHLRAGRFDRRAFWVMAPPSIVGAIVGGFLSGLVPGTLLILAISLIVLEQGYELLRARGAAGASDAPRSRDLRWVVTMEIVGFGIGVLGGLVGLILGTLRLPAMLRAGVAVKDAVATNLAVGFFVGVAGLIGHFAGGTVDLPLAALLIPPAVVGAILGARWTGRFSERGLRRSIGAILIGVGALLLVLLAVGIPHA